VVRVFTSFYAGVNAVFEVDLKKLIALSTLSHLGFIGLALFSGLLNLAFFHMLSHALFKSLLFISMGDIMTNMAHSQDRRYLSGGLLHTPASVSVIIVSLARLMGLPSLTGFFSKDLVLETLLYSNSSYLVVACVFFNLGFTYYYTYQLFAFFRSGNKLRSYGLLGRYGWLHSTLLLVLRVFTLVYRSFFFSFVRVSDLFLCVPVFFKFYPLVLNMRFFILLIVTLALPSSFRVKKWSYISRMLGLAFVTMGAISYTYYWFSYYVCRSVEGGRLVFSLVTYPKVLTGQIVRNFIIGSSVSGLRTVVLGGLFLASLVFLL